MLYFTPLADAAIVGSDASVMMQSEWNAEGNEIIGRRLKDGERSFAAVRAKWQKEGDGLTALSGVVSYAGCSCGELGEEDGYRLYEVRPTEDEYKIEIKMTK